MNDHPVPAVRQPRASPLRAVAPAWRRRSRAARHLLRLLMVAVIFAVSLLPALPQLNGWNPRDIPPVEELRPLASYPAGWEGSYLDTDKNYARFEKAFADHLGLRSMMIRTKNEIDYRLFRTSRRVYYGKNGELYGRSIADFELPLTELVLETKADASYAGLLRLAAQLRAQGTTMVLLTPLQKQYFTRERLPFFAPRVADDARFMRYYQRLKATPELHFVDFIALLRANEHKFPPYYKQDFHWTGPLAVAVSADTVRVIAELEGVPLRWRHQLEVEQRPFVGVETRFAGRLNTDQQIIEPFVKHNWPELHTRHKRDADATGIEFDTGLLARTDLLPPTCMFGNSFTDGMVDNGLVEHFQQFTRLSRKQSLESLPKLVAGRCKYLIMQVLDIQAVHWSDVAMIR